MLQLKKLIKGYAHLCTGSRIRFVPSLDSDFVKIFLFFFYFCSFNSCLRQWNDEINTLFSLLLSF